MLEIKMNYKSAFTVFFVFITIAGIIFFIQIYYTDNFMDTKIWSRLLQSEQSNPHQKRIFIIGSSQVYVLNTTHIQDYITKFGERYEIYNLAIQSDRPQDRMENVDKIISLKPEIVVYGISLRDFENEDINSNEPLKLLPDPHNFFIKLLSPLANFIKDYFNVTDEPEITTLKLLNQFLKISSDPLETIHNEDEIKRSHNSSKPFRGINTADNKDVIALSGIITKLKNHNIKVVIFSVPYPKIFLDSISTSDKYAFNSILDSISQKYGMKIYSLQDKYENLNIWADPAHVAKNNRSIIYSDDVAKIILGRITNSAV